MTGPLFIAAGEQFFYSHPYWGTVIGGVLPESVHGDARGSIASFTPGPDGRLLSRLTPVMRNPAAREPRFPAPPAVAPVFPSVPVRAGSHLWVG